MLCVLCKQTHKTYLVKAKELKFLNYKKTICEGMSADIFKKIYESISDQLLDLINTSLREGIVPSKWKKSTIVPIPKVSAPKQPHEVHPINMLPIYEKILEICVNKQLSHYFESNNLFYNKQFGFRKNKSTESALQLLFSKWRMSLNDNKFIILTRNKERVKWEFNGE
jgi:hypothetical protein